MHAHAGQMAMHVAPNITVFHSCQVCNWVENKNLIELLNLQDVAGLDPGPKLSDFIQDKKWNFHKLQQFVPNQMILKKL